MRVLVATDSWRGSHAGAGLDSKTVGTALARAWAELGDEVAVIPMGAAGQGFGRCLEQLTGVRPLCPELPPAGSDRWTASSRPLADYLREAAPAGTQGRVLEIAAAPWRDGGRGACPAIEGPVTLVTTRQESERPLTGLRGLVSVEGRAEGMDPARMLSLDQQLCDWAQQLTGRPDAGAAPGTGAAGGLGLLVSALGGQVATGPEFLMDAAGAETTAAAADLIVTGCQELNMMTLEGEVVSAVTELAGRVGVPVIAVTATSSVSARELRESGLEAAMPLGASDAGPVARTWHW